jgi:hypothetical protein
MSPPRPRPTPVSVIAYLHIIFAGLWLFIFVCAGVLLVVFYNFLHSPAQGPATKQAEELEMLKGVLRATFESMGRHIPYFWEIQIAQTILSVVLTLVLLVAGIGLLGMKPWARVASIVYGVVAILEKFAELAFTIAYVLPAQAKINEDVRNSLLNSLPPGVNPPTTTSNPLLESASSFAGSLIALIYPVVVLIIMLLPGVTAAFRRPVDEPPSGGSGVDDDYFGYDRPSGKEDF